MQQLATLTTKANEAYAFLPINFDLEYVLPRARNKKTYRHLFVKYRITHVYI